MTQPIPGGQTHSGIIEHQKDSLYAELCAMQRSSDAWQEMARQHLSNEQYYRGLLVQIGEMLGEEAYTSDDGSKQEDVLCAKIPELVQSTLNKIIEWQNLYNAQTKELIDKWRAVSDELEQVKLQLNVDAIKKPEKTVRGYPGDLRTANLPMDAASVARRMMLQAPRTDTE